MQICPLCLYFILYIIVGLKVIFNLKSVIEEMVVTGLNYPDPTLGVGK